MSAAWGKCANCDEVLFGLNRCCMTAHQTPRPLVEEPDKPCPTDCDCWMCEPAHDSPPIWIGDRP